MREQFELDTPEAITLAYDIAGIGTRFLAALADVAVIALLAIAIVLGWVGLSLLGEPFLTAATVLASILLFLLFFGYFLLFEIFWSGQTPGKRLMKIRVIKITGYPIGFIEALVRNVVRIADFLPSLYGVGLVTMFISTESRRLGDYAAGTIVIKERTSAAPLDLTAPVTQSIGAQPALGEVDPEETDWNLPALSAHDLTIMHEFLARAPMLPPDVCKRIGDEIAVRVADAIGARHPLDPVRFLQRVLFLRERSA